VSKWKIYTASVAAESKHECGIEAATPDVNNNAAASPRPRPAASAAVAVSAGRAAGTICRQTVAQRLVPRARHCSASAGSTALSPEMNPAVMIGAIRQASVRTPVATENPNPSTPPNSAAPNKPHTMRGTPMPMLSTMWEKRPNHAGRRISVMNTAAGKLRAVASSVAAPTTMPVETRTGPIPPPRPRSRGSRTR